MSSWASSDRRTLLHFSDATLETFRRYAQLNDDDSESGGLLLGSVHGGHLLVQQATAPTPWDRRRRHLFERMPYGHASIARARWVLSRGKIRYLGEWHTHPEDHPRPSSLDRSEWNQLARKRIDKRPLLAVIVGRASLHVELVSNQSRAGVLAPVSS